MADNHASVTDATAVSGWCDTQMEERKI